MMLIKPFLAVAGLAAVTQGILLPPTITSADSDIVNALPIEYAAKAQGQNLSLDCSHCPFPASQSNGDKGWTTGLNSQLLLNFRIEHDDVDKLTINGVQVYPHTPSIELLTASQVLAGIPTTSADGTTSGIEEVQTLGYEIFIRPIAKANDRDQLELIGVRLQIVEIADMFVDGLPSVELQLVKTKEGKLMIASLNTAPTSNPKPEAGKKCASTLCKWRAMLSGKLAGIKSGMGCGSKASGGKAPGKHPHSNGRPGSHGHHGPHRHHRHHGFTRFLHALKSVAIHILVPVFVGIAVGMTASIIGMVVGHTLVFLWRTFYRRGQKGSYSKVQQRECTLEDDNEETKSFLEHHGPPPVYEDVILVEEKISE